MTNRRLTLGLWATIAKYDLNEYNVLSAVRYWSLAYAALCLFL